MRKIIFILSFTILLVSCNNTNNNTNNILINDTKAMADFIFDIHLSESMLSNSYIVPSENKKIYTKIFSKHNVTPADFDSAVVYYSNNHLKHKEVYEIVLKKLNNYLKFSYKDFFTKYPSKNINIWKDYAVFPKDLYKLTQFLPYYICPKPEYLNKPIILGN